jgi:hypothetical protein
MSIDFQQVRQQIKEMSSNIPASLKRLEQLKAEAGWLLNEHANNDQELQLKVETIAHSIDPSVRCALPAKEPLNSSYPNPNPPEQVTLLAADGSQIYLDRHAAVEYFLINIGTIQMDCGSAQAPDIKVFSDFYYGDVLNFSEGYFDEDRISMMRDLRERRILAEQAAQIPTPVVTLTDGQLELWGAKTTRGQENIQFRQSLDDYLDALLELESSGAITAGYIDKPGEDYVIRLLEIASQPEKDAKNRTLRGVRDAYLFADLLAPGQRSAIFEIQSRSASVYKRRKDSLALYIFYLNVGRPNHPWLARVELPGWVVKDIQKVNILHAILIQQCQVLGSRPYPYLLHRAHETAVVTLDEKNQLENMIQNELRKHGSSGEESQKQGLKSLPGKERHRR